MRKPSAYEFDAGPEPGTILGERLPAFAAAPAPDPQDALYKNRYDTKYIFAGAQLPDVLSRLVADYRICRYENRSIQTVESIYFDDSGLTLYQDHQRGKLHRYKIRLRFYAASDFACLEIKLKTNRHATHKWRRRIPRSQFAAGVLSDEDLRFLERTLQCPPHSLVATVRVRYTRLALQSRESDERVTFDVGLAYADSATGTNRPAGDFVVAEVKQASLSLNSPFRRLMRELRIAPISFSKYCYGVYLFCPAARHNRLKRNYLTLERKKSLWLTTYPRSVHGPF